MRLFLALPIPDLLRFRALALAKNVPDAKWRSEEQLHLTVQFLGNTTQRKAEQLDQRLADITFAPLELELAGVGLLGRFGRPSLHIAVKQQQALTDLREQIRRITRSMAIPLQSEKYVPHITLAYLPVTFNKVKVHEWLEYHRNFSAKLHANQLNLYQSESTKNGQFYHICATYPATQKDQA